MDLIFYFSMIKHYFWLLRWYDACEIACYVIAIYYFSLWLAHDKKKNLVFPFYSYCLALCGTKLIGFFTVHFLLLYAAPVVCMLFIIVHQQILQKNFITLSKVSLNQTVTKDDWLEVFMHASLYAINQNKPFFAVIEQEHMIGDYINSPFFVNALLKNELCELLIDSPHFNPEKMLWITTEGTLKSINTSWQNITQDGIFDDITLTSWQRLAVAITQKTDALCVAIFPEERMFTFIAHGTMMQKLSATALFSMVRTNTLSDKQKKNVSFQSKGIFHEPFTAKSSLEQKQL